MAKILFVSPISTKGGPVYILLKFVEFVRQTHDIAVLAPGDGELFESLNRMGIRSFRTDYQNLKRRGIPWLCRLIRKEGFDLVYGNSFRTAARNALIATKLVGRPFIWHINEIVKGKTAKQWRMAPFLRLADAVVADASASFKAIGEHVSSDRIELIYNGIEVSEYDINVNDARQKIRKVLQVPSNELVVVNAGYICERKGQAYSIEAAEGILNVFPNVTFIFLGELNKKLDYVQQLQARVSMFERKNKIQFLGFRDDFPEILVGSDVFLHTAKRDPFPVVVLGAMSAKLPVVAFDVDGLGEQVVHEETGYLVPFNDLNGIINSLHDSLSDPVKRRRLGINGRQRVERLFTAQQMGKYVNELINKILAQS